MIKYSLRCAEGHAFEGWFADAAAFEDQRARDLLSCAVCGDARVEKALMAPRVRPSRAVATPPAPAQGPDPRRIEIGERERRLAELRRRVEESSEYVGLSFAAEARAIHEGEAEERPIWGEARPEEARALIEDGVPVAPLPFGPRRKSN